MIRNKFHRVVVWLYLLTLLPLISAVPGASVHGNQELVDGASGFGAISSSGNPTEFNDGGGGGTGVYPGNSNWTTGSLTQGTWETWESRLGDVARAKFYMDLHAVILNEVFYDGSSGDDGFEWIELYNVGSEAVDLSGFCLGNGGALYTDSTVQLQGVVASGATFVVGGPTSNATNGNPEFDQVLNFSPDLQNSGTVGDGVALFDVPCAQMNGATIPIDAVVYGPNNDNGLIDETGAASPPEVGDAPAGSSIERVDVTGHWQIQSAPTPNEARNLQPVLEAEPSFALFQDPFDGATGFKVDVTRVFNPATDDDVVVDLESFQARFTYQGASANPAFPAGTLCVNIFDLREMDFPLNNRDIDNVLARTTFNGVDPAGVPWPADLGHALTRLNGSANQKCRVNLEVTPVTDTDGNPVSVPAALTQLVQRGDAQADGKVTIADALFIAQYLVGSRDACTTVLTPACLHSVNAASVRPDGAFDKITMADALVVAQYLVGLRDEFYNLVPSSQKLKLNR